MFPAPYLTAIDEPILIPFDGKVYCLLTTLAHAATNRGGIVDAKRG
jgi:hypothetical protein